MQPLDSTAPNPMTMTTNSNEEKPVPVVVIGAGASGLTAIKCCLEDGLEVVCFEKTDDIGGLWRFRENDALDGSDHTNWTTGRVASVMKNTVINSSKEMSSYSDFPAPPHFPNFMHHKQQVEYFDMYADAFDLRRHIRLQHEVQHVQQTDDHEDTGRWLLTVKDLQSEQVQHLVARGVIICSGHHSHPNVPDFNGLSEFKGRVIHASTYKDFKGFEDLRVAVIGIGNSGGDIAVELSKVSSKVYLSTRRGTWVINRVGLRGLPTDYVHLRRFLFGRNRILPKRVVDYCAEFMHMNRFDHELYNLKPDYRFFMQHAMVNDLLPNCILCGTLTIKNDVSRFVEHGVIFKGEPDRVYELDAVILATGYNIRFPFVDSSVLSVESSSNRVHLYKNVFPPSRSRHPTLAVIGLIQPLGSIVPISEMQSRWVSRVIARKQPLPSEKDMEADIERSAKVLAENYVQTPRHSIQVNYMDYMDEVADLIGVRPNLRRILFADPWLFVYCMFGANMPYQYRLDGPHQWAGAREAIAKCRERVLAPMQTRIKPAPTAPLAKSQVLTSTAPAIIKGLWAFIAMTFSILMLILCFALV